MRFSSELPLTVYLWGFLPAILCIITISGGQQIVHKSGSAGLFLLWGGVVLLGAYAAFSYSRLARH
jgi:arginine exporter protein ArgO